MARILTGVQNTGVPHLGNLMGVILPSIKFAHSIEGSFFFIADLHSLTHIKDPKKLKKFTYKVASVWLSCGLDSGNDRIALYRQSDISEVTELLWYLNCFFPFKRLKLAHSFKEKSSYLNNVNLGLFTYPILMASDILLSGAEKIHLGRDQLQHIEITREIAKRLNKEMVDIFILPGPIVNEWYITGSDGKKMSKSRGNVIDIFLSDMGLYKQVITIKTDNSSLHATKNIDRDTVYYLYKLLATKGKVYEMKDSFLEGDYSYDQAKEALYSLLLDGFYIEREKFAFFIQNTSLLDKIIAKGALKASKAAKITIDRIRKALGFQASNTFLHIN